MNTFEDRKKGYEAKYLKVQEAQFKIRAKRNKFLGLWAAEIVKPENIETLISLPDIDGALVGGACLKAEPFMSIIKVASHYQEKLITQ